MKLISLISFLFQVILLNAQINLPHDSLNSKINSLEGARNPNIYFKNFKSFASDSIYYTSDSLKNKITFVNFWFESCAPCIAEFESLNELYLKFKKNNKFQFISFTFETPFNVLRVKNKYSLQYPIISIALDSIYSLNYQNGFPTNMIVDNDGKIKYIKSGGFTDKERAKSEIEKYFVTEIHNLLEVR